MARVVSRQFVFAVAATEGTSRTVNVPAGGATSTSFAVSCAAAPPTDHNADPETSITAFRSSSSVCADPSRGVEIDATGREDTGGVVAYTLALCDNGPANSGMDFSSVFIPSEGFRRSGQVASGGIVKF